MKMISKGLMNKILNIDDKEFSKSSGPIDGMEIAFQTTTHPYTSKFQSAVNPLNDPALFMIYFQRIL